MPFNPWDETKLNGRFDDVVSNIRQALRSGVQVYEQRRVVDEYIQFHFGKPEDIMPYKDGPTSALRFTARCAELCARHTKSIKIGGKNGGPGNHTPQGMVGRCRPTPG